MPALHDSDITVMLMMLQIVIEVVINFCFWTSLKSATDCCQTERQMRCIGLCTHCMCLSTMPVWELSTNDWKGTMAS